MGEIDGAIEKLQNLTEATLKRSAISQLVELKSVLQTELDQFGDRYQTVKTLMSRKAISLSAESFRGANSIRGVVREVEEVLESTTSDSAVTNAPLVISDSKAAGVCGQLLASDDEPLALPKPQPYAEFAPAKTQDAIPTAKVKIDYSSEEPEAIRKFPSHDGPE